MMKIGVLFPLTLLIFSSGIHVNCLVGEIKSEGIMKENEIADQANFLENYGSPIGYGAEPKYRKISPLYYSNIMKRSAIDRTTGRRQTGIIYGDGKPIGILQPYEESFKFMPIKEEKVYSLDGGRSDLNQQEPYLNLMYPLARFARSEDALKMAEYEASRAEFLEKHYPSMLVDFKIRDKLNANQEKSAHRDIKREEQKTKDLDRLEQKRDLRLSADDLKTEKRESQPVQKRENHSASSQENQRMTQKREAEKPQKRDIEDSRKRDAGNAESIKKASRKRDAEISQNLETKSQTTIEKRQIEAEKLANIAKQKRESSLTNNQFDKLTNAVSKRHSQESADMIENDLRGLLNDMGLIEDNLEDNAEEMEQARSAVVEDDESEEAFDSPVLPKEKIEYTLEQKREDHQSISNKEDSDQGEGENVEKKRTNLDASKKKRRVIDVNFITGNRGNNLQPVLDGEVEDNCSRASDIPNKREATAEEDSDKKDQKKMVDEKQVEFKIPEVAVVSTTETYSQYEERVAREIKNKIQQLKEEVKRELGALEEDNDEEDEDEETVGEPQRKKRFVVNTLLDEEDNDIDPNSNVDNTELLPHVRRRRMLSIDMTDSSEHQQIGEDSNVDMGSVFDKDKNEYDTRNAGINNDNLKEETSSGRDKSMEEDALKYLEANNYNRLNFNDDIPNRYSNLRWANTPLYFKRVRNYYSPQFRKRSLGNYNPWNTMQNSRKNLNSGVYSYESEGERNEAQENRANSVADMTKKMQEWKYNSLPKANKDQTAGSPSEYNQNYYVYYLGKNQDRNIENPLASGNGRRNPLSNYEQMRMVYPQYNDNSNRMQNKAQYVKTSNDDQNQKSMMLRIMYDMPSVRRRKRQVANNFFVRSKDTEDEIATSIIYKNIPQYVIHETKKSNNNGSYLEYPLRSFGELKSSNLLDGETLKNQESDNTHANEKGEENFSSYNETGVGTADMKTGGTHEKMITPITFQEDKEPLGSGYSDFNDEPMSGEDNLKFEPINFQSQFSNLTTRQYMHQKREKEKNLNFYLESPNGSSSSDLRSKESEDESVKSHNILSSSTTNMAETIESLSVENATYSIEDFYARASGRRNTSVPVTAKMGASATYDYIKEIGSRDKPLGEITNIGNLSNLTLNSLRVLPLITSEKYGGRKVLSDIERTNLYVDDQSRDDTSSSYPSDRSEIVMNKIDKNVLYVPNEDLSQADWKRRKRAIEDTQQQQESVRHKRLDWFWPIKSPFGGNAPQVDEYEQFEMNEAPDSDKETSERLRDNSAGVGNNYEDLGIESGDYNRRKRQQRDIRSLITRRNALPYNFGGNFGRIGSYIPVSRRRRYANGWYREPRQQLLTDMSDIELFGALPQSYNGELNRYKRVRRDTRGMY